MREPVLGAATVATTADLAHVGRRVDLHLRGQDLAAAAAPPHRLAISDRWPHLVGVTRAAELKASRRWSPARPRSLRPAQGGVAVWRYPPAALPI